MCNVHVACCTSCAAVLPIEKQIRAIGATWLDRQLVEGGASTLMTGFGALMRQAVSDRVDFLIMLASGRFAMSCDGLGFELVPWRPVIENSIGKSISAVVRGRQITWDLGRQRGLSI